MRALAAALLALAAALAWAEPLVDAMRGATPILEATQPPRLSNWVNDDNRMPRNFAQQPPVIPHRVDGYQIDKNFNKCLDCHARGKTELSNAVPVSATHYKNRDGKMLDHVSTRRYFCQQCHVAQDPVRPLVGNSFRGVGPVGPSRAAGSDEKTSQRSTP
jgi:nitrate reductase (cytochrome), electron transfer subunit